MGEGSEPRSVLDITLRIPRVHSHSVEARATNEREMR